MSPLASLCMRIANVWRFPMRKRPSFFLMAGALPLVAGSCGTQSASVAARPAVGLPFAAAPAAAAPFGDQLAQRLLAAHNRHRATVGAPPLRWSAKLAADAAAYAPRLAAIGRLEHSPRASRPGQRENLWMGPAGRHSLEGMIDNWAEERAQFRPGLFPDVSTSGNWMDVSHYTQMIWPSTTEVGCGVHRASWDYLVCRYTPPGNRDGQRVG